MKAFAMKHWSELLCLIFGFILGVAMSRVTVMAFKVSIGLGVLAVIIAIALMVQKIRKKKNEQVKHDVDVYRPDNLDVQ